MEYWLVYFSVYRLFFSSLCLYSIILYSLFFVVSNNRIQNQQNNILQAFNERRKKTLNQTHRYKGAVRTPILLLLLFFFCAVCRVLCSKTPRKKAADNMTTSTIAECDRILSNTQAQRPAMPHIHETPNQTKQQQQQISVSPATTKIVMF